MKIGTKKGFASCGVIVLLATAVFASDLSGTWNAKVSLGWKGSGTPTFVLKQSGEKLTGTYSGTLGQSNVNGTVKGDDVVLEFEISGLKVRYTGKLDKQADKIEGNVDYGGRASGPFTATRKK
jgi:hypothetical protein